MRRVISLTLLRQEQAKEIDRLFAVHSNILISISLQPNFADLGYFKL